MKKSDLARCGLVMLCCVPGLLFAAQSRIIQVTLYPGSATIERIARVEAGAKQLDITCLPKGFDLQSVRIKADVGIRIGDVRVETAKRKHTSCINSTLKEQIQVLEDQRAEVEAEQKANALAVLYLNWVSNPAVDEKNKLSSTPINMKELGQTTAALLKSGKNVFWEQHRFARRFEEIDLKLEKLRQEEARIGGENDDIHTMRIRLATERAGDVHVEYQVPYLAGWKPAYQVSLNSSSGELMLERQATISQRTGEDWRSVKLYLSTGQPQANPAGPQPTIWQLSVMEEKRALARPALKSAPVAAARMDMAMEQTAGGSADVETFDVSTQYGEFATRFDVQGTVSLDSGAERMTLSLASLNVPASIHVRAMPERDPYAYLVATMATPEGVWPRGAMMLQRDGAFIGTMQWEPKESEKTTLFFGRDEMVQIKVDKDQDFRRTTGIVSNRVEREIAATYTVLNQHRIPMKFEVLEASPVSADEAIRIHTKFIPEPTQLRWQDLNGVIAWEQEIGAGKSASFSKTYLISYPEGASVVGLP